MERATTELRIATAVEHACILLEFVSSRRDAPSIDQNTIKTIVELRKKFDAAEDIETELEVKFWETYRQLANDVLPVTVESIRASRAVQSYSGSTTNPVGKFRKFLLTHPLFSMAARTVYLYGFAAVLVLVAIVFVQVFWLAGASITRDLSGFQSQFSEQRVKQKERLEEISNDEVSRDPELAATTADMTDTSKIINALMQSLKHWNRQWSEQVGFFIGAPFKSEAFEELAELGKETIEVTEATMFLQAVAMYALPLLYGLLGAFAYVLREMKREIKTVTFTTKSRIGYSLHLALGLLAGIAVGFLISSGGRPGNEVTEVVLTLRELSPLALSFVAGYSVELIFTALDRIVAGTSQ